MKLVRSSLYQMSSLFFARWFVVIECFLSSRGTETQTQTKREFHTKKIVTLEDTCLICEIFTLTWVEFITYIEMALRRDPAEASMKSNMQFNVASGHVSIGLKCEAIL